MAAPSEIDTMKAPLRGLSAHSRLQNERVERLKRKLQEATQEASAASASYRKHLIRCARADCLQLTEMMHKKLPAELRDVVYHYLLVEERPIPVRPYYHFRKYDGGTTDELQLGSARDKCDIESDDEDINFEDESVVLPDGRLKHDHSHRPPSDIVMPNSHVLNPRYAGQAFLIEAHKVYYTHNTFSICNVENAIENFLYQPTEFKFMEYESRHLLEPTEELGLESLFVPAKCIRNLQIRVKFEHFESAIPQDATMEEMFAYEQYILRHGFLHALASLMQTSQQGELNIEFVIMTELPGFADYQTLGRRFVIFLEAIRSTVYTTMYDREGTTIRVTHHDETNWPFPRDLTGLFALTKEQWEQEKATPRAQRVADFYIAPAPMGTLSAIPVQEMLPLLRERWGMDSVLATKCTYPVTEGKYWP